MNAMPAIPSTASTGATKASTEVMAAATSSTRLTTGAPMPPVVTFTAGRATALTAWTPPAITMPATIQITGFSPLLDMDVAMSSPPAAGRITVWMASLTWSTPGTLSASTSMTRSTAISATDHHSPMSEYGCGSSIQPAASAIETASSGM